MFVLKTKKGVNMIVDRMEKIKKEMEEFNGTDLEYSQEEKNLVIGLMEMCMITYKGDKI